MAETWNREELYRDVWQEPMSKLAKKYGISDVMIAKICHRLQIPVPGRGYWARKASGQTLSVIPLSDIQDLPVIERFKFPAPEPAEPKAPEPEPTDPEYIRIKEVEVFKIELNLNLPTHPLVATTIKAFKSATTNDRGFRAIGYVDGALDLRISPASFERAVPILNTVVVALEKLGFPVTIVRDSQSYTQRSIVTIFGQKIPFDFVEKYNQIRIPEKEQGNFLHARVRYQPNGILEFRISPSGYKCPAIRDKKQLPLEHQLTTILTAFVQEGREAKLRAERWAREAIERQEHEIQMQKLAKQIQEEESKLKNLDDWVTGWVRAHQYREFIAALELSWKSSGKDLSPDTESGKQLAWMRQQADRLDPLVQSPKSILDRKNEISRYRY